MSRIVAVPDRAGDARAAPEPPDDAPLDKLFGTFHDGSQAAHLAMRDRMRARHGTVG